MKNKWINKVYTPVGIICSIAIPVLVLACCLNPGDSRDSITIMTYNVQEFFDDVNDGTEYDEYVPGTGKWNTVLFEERLTRIGHVIKNSIPGGPDIIALQEVENVHTLEILCYQGLKGMGYVYLVMVPEPGSATNTGIISRIPIDHVRAYSLNYYSGYPLRKIIEVEIVYKGELLYLFNDHWKSKRGGAEETEKARMEGASVIISRINEILRTEPFADIIVLGDFNENLHEYIETGEEYQTAFLPSYMKLYSPYYDSSLFLSSLPEELQQGNGPCILFDSWYDKSDSVQGSYVFRDTWQTPDHIFLSYGLFDDKGFFYERNSFYVMNKPFLLDPVTSYPREWDHTRGKWGYSDHLPLVLTLLLS